MKQTTDYAEQWNVDPGTCKVADVSAHADQGGGRVSCHLGTLVCMCMCVMIVTGCVGTVE